MPAAVPEDIIKHSPKLENYQTLKHTLLVISAQLNSITTIFFISWCFRSNHFALDQPRTSSQLSYTEEQKT